MKNETISIEAARALGYVIDYPHHPHGIGAPYRLEPFRPCREAFREFDRFRLDPRTPLAGFLVSAEGYHAVPAYLWGYTREDAIAATRDTLQKEMIS